MESTSLGMPHLELVGLEVKAKPEVPPPSCVTAEAMAGGLQGHISSSRCPQHLCQLLGARLVTHRQSSSATVSHSSCTAWTPFLVSRWLLELLNL